MTGRVEDLSIFRRSLAASFAAEHGGGGELRHGRANVFRAVRGEPLPRFSFFQRRSRSAFQPRGFGQMPAALLPFILIGLVGAARRHGAALLAVFGAWLVLFPLPAAFSVGRIASDPLAGGHALRALAGAPLFAALAGMGAAEAFRWITAGRWSWQHAARLLWALTVAAGLAWNGAAASRWFGHYFNEYPKYADDAFGRMTQAAFPAANLFLPSKKRVLVREAPVPFPDYYVAFYAKAAPEEFQKRMKEYDHHSLGRPLAGWGEYGEGARGTEDYIVLTSRKMPFDPLLVFRGKDNRDYLYLYERPTSIDTIRRAEYCGPFPIPASGIGVLHFEKDYPAEFVSQCDEEKKWRDLTVPSDRDAFDLWADVSKDENVYALVRVSLHRTDAAERVKLLAGSDDGFNAWLNKEHFFSSPDAQRSFVLDIDQTDLPLREGPNELLVRALNGPSAWMLSLRLLRTKDY
ncbi:MAG: hypothetical protein M5R36_06745 [Deltaproteobacteria bacterium]|nr:hypothetical protein [Deltaproteobacteria bacterium]